MPQLSELPADLIMVSLFPFLSTSSLVSLGCTSRLWYSSILATDSLTANALWKKRLAEDRNFPVNNTARQHGWLHLYKAAFFPRIYVWGQQGQGRLGLTPQELARYSEHLEISTPSPLRSFPKGTSIVHCSSGGWSFHALDSKGRVWFWGTLDGSGWAAPGQPLSNPFKTQTTPTLLEAEFDRHKIVQLESGRSHAAALDSVGHVFEWRCWGRVARVRDAERRWATAKRINAGWDFTLLLVDGDSAALTYHRPQIYIFWQARQSEISRAALSQPVISSEGYEHPTVTFDFDVNSLKLPDPPFDQDEKVLQMAAGDKHAFILSSRGRVYMIDISPVPVPVRQAVRPQPPQLPQLPQVHEEAEGMRPSERERLSAAFMSGERSWKYLENFCDASRLQQRPELNGLDLSNLHMNHISAHFQNFTVYDTALGVVLLGSLVEQSEELRPLIKPELQGRDIIKVVHGDYHFGALTSGGELLTWGNYAGGALGHGRHNRFIDNRDNGQLMTPSPVDFNRRDQKKRNLFCFDAAFAGWHSSALAIDIDSDASVDDDDDEEQQADVRDGQYQMFGGRGGVAGGRRNFFNLGARRGYPVRGIFRGGGFIGGL